MRTVAKSLCRKVPVAESWMAPSPVAFRVSRQGPVPLTLSLGRLSPRKGPQIMVHQPLEFASWAEKSAMPLAREAAPLAELGMASVLACRHKRPQDDEWSIPRKLVLQMSALAAAPGNCSRARTCRSVLTSSGVGRQAPIRCQPEIARSGRNKL